jgi:hypothetical protein
MQLAPQRMQACIRLPASAYTICLTDPARPASGFDDPQLSVRRVGGREAWTLYQMLPPKRCIGRLGNVAQAAALVVGLVEAGAPAPRDAETSRAS